VFYNGLDYTEETGVFTVFAKNSCEYAL
jgi:hypothetical protein